MDLMKAMEERHSVRSYTDKPIEGEVKDSLFSFIDKCAADSGLTIRLVLDEEKAFDSFMAHYGKFSGVRNYVVLAGRKTPDLDEKCGYYGEKIVLHAQSLGLNTCWVAMTYSKKNVAVRLEKDEKLCIVIAIGYGKTSGTAHKSKAREAVMSNVPNTPDWFLKGIDAALLAPTAMNQQKFAFSLNGNKVSAKAGIGFYRKIDLGIAKCHFELGAGRDNFEWA